MHSLSSFQFSNRILNEKLFKRKHSAIAWSNVLKEYTLNFKIFVPRSSIGLTFWYSITANVKRMKFIRNCNQNKKKWENCSFDKQKQCNKSENGIVFNFFRFFFQNELFHNFNTESISFTIYCLSAKGLGSADFPLGRT